MKLLNLIQSIARSAYKFRVLNWGLSLLSVVLFFYFILQGTAEADRYLLPTMVLLGWSICLLGISSNFREVPQKPVAGTRLFRRIAMNFRYRLAWFWAAVFLLSSLILIYLSIRSVFMLLA